MISSATEIKIADEVFIVTATMHRLHPDVMDFSIVELMKQAELMNVSGEIRQGLRPHFSQHCVANLKPNPSRLRILFESSKNRRRLIRASDSIHPERDGRYWPELGDIPEEFRELVVWARERFGEKGPTSGRFEGLLQLRGSGRECWADESGDEMIRRLRGDWD